MRRADAVSCILQHRARLATLGVTHAYLFGSVARDLATPESDIDVMVDLDEAPEGRKPLFGDFDISGIQHELTLILGRRVDVVVRSDALQPGKRLRATAEGELFDVF